LKFCLRFDQSLYVHDFKVVNYCFSESYTNGRFEISPGRSNIISSLNNCDYSSFHASKANVESQNAHRVLDKREKECVNNASYSNISDSSAPNVIFCNGSAQRVNVSIWTMDCFDNTVVLGCEDGCLEFWDCSTGELRVRDFE